MGLCGTAVCVVLWLGGGLATPLPLYSSLEGSTDEEDLATSASPPPTSFVYPRRQTTPAGPVPVETDFLGRVVNFLEDNMLLVLVASTLVLLVFLIVCGAFVMSRRRKVNAYYPSSFPSKMYVDHRDKTGGAKTFNEVPEKEAPEQEAEPPVDSHRQLQADIMRAAKSLRTPTKSAEAEASGSGEAAPRHSQADDGSQTCGGVSDQQLPSFPEEKEPSELGPGGETTGGSGSSTEPSPAEPEAADPGGDGSLQEPLIGRSVRPSSLHIHNDSATLQLIAGEKTAF